MFLSTTKGRNPVESRPSLATYATIGRYPGWLDGGDVIRLHALLALGSLVRDLGALIEALEAVAGYTRVVNEEIITALVGGDEAVALLVAEPLYRSLGHIWSPPFVFLGLHCNKNAAPLVEGGASFTIKPTSFTIFLIIPRARSQSLVETRLESLSNRPLIDCAYDRRGKTNRDKIRRCRRCSPAWWNRRFRGAPGRGSPPKRRVEYGHAAHCAT